MSDDDVNIRIKRDTWKRLNSRKEPNDSFNDVLERVLDKVEAEEGNGSRMTPPTAD
ncbi:antitoxin VapB family protein [Halovenus marina]|uniref:antitoxin VapB family protein n=1 Tax=Halovenus marina TaxID=3396621 RepID=UPI003F571271